MASSCPPIVCQCNDCPGVLLTRVYHRIIHGLCTYRCVYVRNVCVEENKIVTVGRKKEIGGEERVGRSRGGRESTIRGWAHAAAVLHTARHETRRRQPRLREKRGAYLHGLRIITNSYSSDAPFGAYSLLVRSTSSTSSSPLWRTTRFSSTRFTSSARLSASE